MTQHLIEKEPLTALVDKKLKHQAQHLLLDKRMSMAKWLNQVLREFVETAQATSTPLSHIHTVRHELQDK